MENLHDQKQALFSPVQMGISGLIGGPVGAGYTIALNYRKRGNEMGFLLTVVSTIALTFIIFVLLYGLPEKYYLQMPKILLMPLFGAPAYAIGKNIFGKSYQELENAGQKAESWKKVLLISIVGFLFMFVGIRTFSDSNPPMKGEQLRGKIGSQRFLFYDKISETEATAIFSKLDELNFYNDKKGQPRVQLLGKDGAILVKIPAEQKLWENQKYLAFYRTTASGLREAFPDKRIIWVLYSETPAGPREMVVE